MPGATSGRPLTTLDTVGSDTPASAAMAASVGLRDRLAAGAGPDLIGSLVGTFPYLSASRGSPHGAASSAPASRN